MVLMGRENGSALRPRYFVPRCSPFLVTRDTDPTVAVYKSRTILSMRVCRSPQLTHFLISFPRHHSHTLNSTQLIENEVFRRRHHHTRRHDWNGKCRKSSWLLRGQEVLRVSYSGASSRVHYTDLRTDRPNTLRPSSAAKQVIPRLDSNARIHVPKTGRTRTEPSALTKRRLLLTAAGRKSQ